MRIWVSRTATYVNAAPLVNHLLDNLLALNVRVVVGNGLTTGLGDLLNNDVRSLLAFVVGSRAQVVDQDLGAARGKEERIRLAETTTSPGDDHDAVLKRDIPVLRGREVSHSDGEKERCPPTPGSPPQPASGACAAAAPHAGPVPDSRTSNRAAYS